MPSWDVGASVIEKEIWLAKFEFLTKSGNIISNMAVQIEGQGRHGQLLLFCDTFNHEQNEVKYLLKCPPTCFALM